MVLWLSCYRWYDRILLELELSSVLAKNNISENGAIYLNPLSINSQPTNYLGTKITSLVVV